MKLVNKSVNKSAQQDRVGAQVKHSDTMIKENMSFLNQP